MSQIRNSKSEIRNHKTYAIIVAGGTGTRMQSAVPKQFLLLNGEPVLMHTIRAFASTANKPEIIVVMHPEFHEYWQQLCTEHQFTIPHQLISGGETRFHSVKNGLALTEDNSLIAVQDAVRPLTSPAIIDKAYEQAAMQGNAIVAVKSRDSIRRLRNGRSENLLRDEIWLVQTPQTFQSSLLKKAYEQPFHQGFTDDASVVEQSGVDILLIEGDHRNMKITFPEDIAIAELLLRQ
ncbi:2-C-methyl-D-erythritol 4-phosphate cytidylyltransferase [Mucilaginibacter yixingensis]|uniref:2-C-methyl-D-erythritol 4-phosphate cytidylyltransferase n=1 Tax=Mucilaginibacter yixingensis TaxID=1295612 RepID=A0A2T5J7A4_9SPHI|nr:2-C-methyl-D-erythritol 4-phosphate cytidylyltransferase [Mucilaginibacter yixingensis]PTQ95032.1 2-C-methyl-D-erythritol 4-phosphate cytidylyltransferase [Mucilaginibacter yixingensis]